MSATVAYEKEIFADIVEAVHLRLITLSPKKEKGRVLYDDLRTAPDSIAAKIRSENYVKQHVHKQTVIPFFPLNIMAGQYDEFIIDVYHNAARTAYYYSHDKDWGEPIERRTYDER